MDSALVSLLSSAGVAGVFCILFVIGAVCPKSVVDDLRRERDYERQRGDAERDRADAAVTAAQATRDVLSQVLQAGQRQQGLNAEPVTRPLPEAERGPT